VDVVIAGALLVVAALVFMGLAIGWWALRKTLSLVRRLVLVALGVATSLVIMASVVGIYLSW
jgi:hypothetical protein